MRYLYGEADEKFFNAPGRWEKKKPLSKCKFQSHPIVEGKTDINEFDVNDATILSKCTPDTLLHLCVKIVDEFPLPMVYTWTIEDICKWLRERGYRQYQNTFRANLISGRSLLLLDASALSAMNIKDFGHIKDLTRSIRSLFYFEMTKFGRSISMYPEFHFEIYKLLRLKTGAKYDVRRSDLWRQMQLIRQKEPNFSHWEILERWMNFDKEPKYREIVGDAQRHNLYGCKAVEPKPPAVVKRDTICHRSPWRLKCLPQITPDEEFVAVCEKCMPPCTCRWSSKKYEPSKVLTYLQEKLPDKYGGIHSYMRLTKLQRMIYRYPVKT